MDNKQQLKASKYLSFILRHKPEAGNLTLDDEGYADVDFVLLALHNAGYSMTFEELVEIVSSDEKGRYSFDVTNCYIRANQGHSVEVDPEKVLTLLTSFVGPTVFYHGTSVDNLSAIAEYGLLKMSRSHVHLSKDVQTAMLVGKRHTGRNENKVAILEVDASKMHEDGYAIYESQNGVIMTEYVPTQYITVRVKLDSIVFN